MLILALCFSCKKEITGANNLNRGHGTWLIETIELTYFDSIGNEIGNKLIEEPGEIVFMETHWGTAPEFLGVYLHFDGNGRAASSHGFNYYSDGERLTIDASVPFPILLEGEFTMTKNKRKKQVWDAFLYFSDANYPNRISIQETITLSKKQSF